MFFPVLFFALLVGGCRTSSPSAASAPSEAVGQEETNPEDAFKLPGTAALWSPFQRQGLATYQYLLAETLTLQGDMNNAARLFDSVYSLDPNPYVGVRLVALKAATGDTTVVTEAQRMSLLYPKDAQVALLYGQLLAATGDLPGARVQLKKTIAIDPTREAAYVQLVQVWRELKKPDEALSVAKQMTQTLPNSPAAWSLLSRLYLLSHNRKDALVPARRAYELQNTNPELILIYAIALELSNRSREAVVLYEQLYKVLPTTEELSSRMAAIYQQLGNLGDALQLLEEITQKGEPKPALLLQKALVLWELDRFEEASQILIDLAKSNPESDRINFLAALSQERRKRFSEAKELLQKVSQESPLFVPAQVRLSLVFKEEGLAAKEAGKTSQAKKLFQEAYALVDSLMKGEEFSEEIFAAKADILAAQERFGDAARIMEEAYTQFPSKPRLLFLQGVYEERAGSIRAAIKTMRRVIEADPSNSAAFNYLGYMFAERGENLDEAEQLVQKALVLKPGDGFYLDSLGWIYFQKKDYAKAQETLGQALKVSPDEGVIMEHVADVKRAIGQVEEARDLYQKALSTQLEPRDRERIQQKLQAVHGTKP